MMFPDSGLWFCRMTSATILCLAALVCAVAMAGASVPGARDPVLTLLGPPVMVVNASRPFSDPGATLYHTAVRTPSSVASATCTHSGGEGSCPGNDVGNANYALSSGGGSVSYIGAASTNKQYTHVYDFGDSFSSVTRLEAIGSSGGHWCEDGAQGVPPCHNDNSFSFSLGPSSSGPWNSLDSAVLGEACAYLNDGCFYYSATGSSARYLRVVVSSGCAGCSNQDYVDVYRLWVDANDTTLVTSDLSSAVNFDKAGTYVVTYSATDSFGQVAATVSRTIIVEDIDPPFIAVNPPNPFYLEANLTDTDYESRDPGAFALDYQEGIWSSEVFPQSLVSATCTMTGSEPECPSTDTARGLAMMSSSNGQSAYFVGAAGGSKEHTYVYDFGTPMHFYRFELFGSSTGCWDENGQVGPGCSNSHNDNVFRFSAGQDPSGSNEGLENLILDYEACNYLNDGCYFHSHPNVKPARYLKLRVTSGCHGCSNTDTVSYFRVWALNSSFDGISSDADSAVNMSVVGNYSVNYVGVDPQGLESIANRTVVVVDTTAPDLQLIGDAVLTIDQYAVYEDAGATVTDNAIQVEVPLAFSVDNGVDTSLPGTYEVAYFSEDEAGNNVTVVRTVEVLNVDECALSLHNCDANAACSDTHGSWECECLLTYEGDGVTCEYIPFQRGNVFGQGMKVGRHIENCGAEGSEDGTLRFKDSLLEVCGGSSWHEVQVDGLSASDERLKEDVKPLHIDDARGMLQQLQGVSYRWKSEDDDRSREIGLIAQQVETVLPSLVKERMDGYKGVEYQKMVALLIEVLKDQQSRIEVLEREVAEMKVKN